MRMTWMRTPRLRVGSFDCGDAELSTDSRRLTRLLGAIVNQAMTDGMTRVRFGIDAPTGEPRMQYFGPVFHMASQRTWWDMTPAPPECYPALLQVCMGLAVLDSRLPLRGTIAAVRNGERLSLSFAADSLDAFELTWSELLASESVRAAGARVQLDPPGWERDTEDGVCPVP